MTSGLALTFSVHHRVGLVDVGGVDVDACFVDAEPFLDVRIAVQAPEILSGGEDWHDVALIDLVMAACCRV